MLRERGKKTKEVDEKECVTKERLNGTGEPKLVDEQGERTTKVHGKRLVKQ